MGLTNHMTIRFFEKLGPAALGALMLAGAGLVAPAQAQDPLPQKVMTSGFSWAAQPSATDMINFTPQPAVKQKQSGWALINCRISWKGDLTECKVAAESKPGFSFGQAALSLAVLYKVNPKGADGSSLEGEVIQFPIAFNPPGTHPAPR